MLTVEEIQKLLGLIAEQHTEQGYGWSDDPFWAALQAKLSIMLAAASGGSSAG